MSIDLPLNATLSPEAPLPIRDLIIIYGGWQPGVDPLAGGSPLPETGSGTADLVGQIKGITPAPFHQILVLPLQGSLPSRQGVSKALNFITMNFHPQGDLIVYGYSAGGTDALTLCREVEKHISFFGLSSGQLQNRATAKMLEKRRIEDSARVRVDLLITVDVAAGPGSARVDRHVPSCVRSNTNFYQTTESRIFSRGGKNQADDNTSTQIDNRDLTGQAEHATIDEFTNSSALEEIVGKLGVVAMPSTAPPGMGVG